MARPRTRRDAIERACLAGMLAPVLFVLVFTLEGWLRPGYDPMGMFVSELSLGSRGWLQIANFLVTGGLLLWFGRGLALAFPEGKATKTGPVLVQIIGLSLAASGPFVTDPSTIFNQESPQGIVHGILGAIVFSLTPVTCFAFVRRFRREVDWRGLASWTLAAGFFLAAGIVVLKISQSPGSELFAWKGLVQRVILIAFLSWLFTVAARLRRILRTAPAAP